MMSTSLTFPTKARIPLERRFVKTHGPLGSLQRLLQHERRDLEVQSIPLLWFDSTKEEEIVKVRSERRVDRIGAEF